MDEKGANMEKVSFITYRSAASFMQMLGKLAATKFLPEFLPVTNFQGLLNDFRKTIKIICTVYCKIRMFPFVFSLLSHCVRSAHSL